MALQRQLSHVRPIVDSVVTSMKPALDAKDLKLSWTRERADPMAFVDPQRIQQIVSNVEQCL
jgi:signal transduction histidine kinase